MNMFLIFISWFAVIMSSIQLIPQTMKALKTKETKDISLLTFVIIMAASGSWIIHGIAKHDTAIIVANTIAFVSATTIVGLKLKYK
jgi:MtN3 and saliva related transmembrane protein